jgi:hypothetical protein
MKHTSKLVSLLGAAAFAATLTTPAFAQTLLVEYKFNDTGTTTASTASSSNTGIMRNSAGVSTDLHGAAGSGVSGAAGDLAFNNTASTGMGNTGTGGYVVQQSNNNFMQGLTSFTVSGWFKTETATMAGNARLIDSKSAGGIWLRTGDGASAGTLLLGVNGGEVSAGATSWNQAATWTFFAVTFSGASNTNNVKFYVGNTNIASSVTAAATVSLTNSGSVAATSNPFRLGNGAAQNDRPFDGYMDNIRIHSGILSDVQINDLRVGDLSTIPEPAHIAMLSGLVGLAACAVRRARNKK